MSVTTGIRQVNRLAANKAFTSNTTLATLATGWAIPIAASQKMHVRWWLPFTEAAGTAGVKLQLLTPAAPGSFLLSFFIYNLVATHVAIDNAGLQTATAAFTGTGANAGNYLAVVEAEIVNGTTAGTLDLQAAQSVSDAGATTFLVGCYADITIYS
jgi:hypothetical protein